MSFSIFLPIQNQNVWWFGYCKWSQLSPWSKVSDMRPIMYFVSCGPVHHLMRESTKGAPRGQESVVKLKNCSVAYFIFKGIFWFGLATISNFTTPFWSLGASLENTVNRLFVGRLLTTTTVTRGVKVVTYTSYLGGRDKIDGIFLHKFRFIFDSIQFVTRKTPIGRLDSFLLKAARLLVKRKLNPKSIQAIHCE